MKILGNIIWLIFGGLLVAIEYFVVSVLLFITIVGIPFGIQTFKLGIFALLPFGKETKVRQSNSGCLVTIMNILWIVLGGIWISISHILFGLFLTLTIIGFPFALQHFKLATLALAPFGREIVDKK